MKLRGNERFEWASPRASHKTFPKVCPTQWIEERSDENPSGPPRNPRVRKHLAWLHWRGNVLYAPIGMDTAPIPRDLHERLLRLGNFQDHAGGDCQLDRSAHLPCVQLETLCRMGHPRLCRTLRLLGSGFLDGCRNS